MQPYLFPYIGYFQLIHVVDSFVIYDDVNFIKGGWINRNFILSQGEKSRFTLQLQGASPNVFINQVSVGSNKRKLLKTIQQNYTKAPYYESVYPLLEDIVLFEEENLARYIEHSLRNICSFLNIETQWYVSSELKKDNSLRGQNKVLEICKNFKADQYINVPGGKDLYNSLAFKESGIELSFIHPSSIKYNQFNNQFVPNLSIIDVLMFNGKSDCAHLIKEYKID